MKRQSIPAPEGAKTLAEVMPYEFARDGKQWSEYEETRAYKYRNLKVVAQYDSWQVGWPGTHKHVVFWVTLENGYHVGFNENPSVGWSFPVA